MNPLWLFFSGILLLILIVVIGAHPERTSISYVELHRRKRGKDTRANEVLLREELLHQIGVFRTPLIMGLIASLAAISISSYGALQGLVVTIVMGLIAVRIGGLKETQSVSKKLFKRIETRLLALTKKYHKVIRLLGGRIVINTSPAALSSREELAYLMEASPVFSAEDRQLLSNALRFKERTVKELMAPWEKVVTIADAELLGPLVLDDLHKSGHSLFPVTKGKAVVGILDISDHTDLHLKESPPVRGVMQHVEFISQTARASEALDTLLATKQQMLVVVDAEERLVGLITLKDVIRAITG